MDKQSFNDESKDWDNNFSLIREFNSKAMNYGDPNAVEDCVRELPENSFSGSNDGDSDFQFKARSRRRADVEQPWYKDMFNFFFLCEMCTDRDEEEIVRARAKKSKDKRLGKVKEEQEVSRGARESFNFK